MGKDKKGSAQSFWSTLPGLLTAIAAVITAVAGLIAALNAAGVINLKGGGTAFSATGPLSQSTTETPAQLSRASDSFSPSGYLRQYFQGVSSDRIFPLEVGADSHLLGPDQINSTPIGIAFTDSGSPIGGMTFQFAQDGQLFQVSSVVDAACNKIESYSNISRGGDRNVLQNFDMLQIQFGTTAHQLRLEYNGSSIEAVFN